MVTTTAPLLCVCLALCVLPALPAGVSAAARRVEVSSSASELPASLRELLKLSSAPDAEAVAGTTVTIPAATPTSGITSTHLQGKGRHYEAEADRRFAARTHGLWEAAPAAPSCGGTAAAKAGLLECRYTPRAGETYGDVVDKFGAPPRFVWAANGLLLPGSGKGQGRAGGAAASDIWYQYPPTRKPLLLRGVDVGALGSCDAPPVEYHWKPSCAYTVKRGESLGVIADKLGTGRLALAARNELPSAGFDYYPALGAALHVVLAAPTNSGGGALAAMASAAQCVLACTLEGPLHPADVQRLAATATGGMRAQYATRRPEKTKKDGNNKKNNGGHRGGRHEGAVTIPTRRRKRARRRWQAVAATAGGCSVCRRPGTPEFH